MSRNITVNLRHVNLGRSFYYCRVCRDSRIFFFLCSLKFTQTMVLSIYKCILTNTLWTCRMDMKNGHAACPCCMSILHVPAAYPCCISFRHVLIAFACCKLMLLVPAACSCYLPCCMSTMHVHAACQCRMSLHVQSLNSKYKM